MKKIISGILAGALAATLCLISTGCGGSKGIEMPTASTTVAPTTKPAATVPTTRAANSVAVNNNVNNNNNNNTGNDTQESQVQDNQSSQAEQQSSQTGQNQNQNQNQNPNNQSSYENSAPGGDAVIQGEQAAMFAALDYSGYDKVVDSQILVENGQEPYYKVTAEDFDTGDVNTYYVYGDGSVVPAGD